MHSLTWLTSLLLAGCIIPGLDTDGRDCPCGAGYVCDPAAGKCVHELPSGDASAAIDASMFDARAVDMDLSDAGLLDAGNIVTLDGEVIELAPGWQVSLYRDLSTGTPYTYAPQDFNDASNGDTDDNQPRVIVPLIAPFNDGFAVLAGRSILELSTSGAAQLHVYTPSAPDAGNYPDVPRDLYFARTVGSIAGHLLVSGTSTGAGDGVFQVSSAWAMTTLLPSNNNATVLFDATGHFDSQTAGQTYFSVEATGSPQLVRLSDSKGIVATSEPPVDDAEVLADGTMAIVIDEDVSGATVGLAQITVAGSAYALQILGGTSSAGARLVTGDLTRLPAGIFAISRPGSFIQASNTVAPITLARSLTTGWTWESAAVPPVEHSLGASTVYLLLESNRALDRDRILLLTPP